MCKLRVTTVLKVIHTVFVGTWTLRTGWCCFWSPSAMDSELIAAHSAHFTGRFLPWHRLYLHTMEGLLKDKCGYKGYMTYWDWTIGKSDRRDCHLNLLDMLTAVVFCQIHTTLSILLFSTLTLWSVLEHSQTRAPTSRSVMGPTMISFVLIL
jgi:hypothetical protein